MPEYIAIITRQGLDAVAKVPKAGTETKISAGSWARDKIAAVFQSFEGLSVPEVKHGTVRLLEPEFAQRAAKSIYTDEALKAAHETTGLQIRARYLGSDYIMLRTKMSEAEMKKARGNPYQGAIDVIMNATRLLYGNKNELGKWIKRMEVEL